ncbi:MAG: hypothetical protein HYU35_02185 [Parcubacteria group bacterium]|nr:hypothetical protein [Parcubacteria group bacterium]
MLYFLYGADTFRSRAKLREIRAALLQKTGGALVTMLSGQECSGPRLEELCQSASLFDPKHIIICENVLEDGLSGKEAQEALACSDRSKHVVLLWEGEVSPALAKDVTALATKAQHFTALTGARLRGWVENAAISRGVRLASGEADQLARRYGGDLWGIANTIELRALGMPYDEENTAAQADRFSFPNAFFARRTHAAWIALEELRAEGVGEEEIFWRFVRQLTNALLLKRLSGRFSLAEAAEKSNLHPFAAKKTLEAISGIEEKELCRWTEYCIALWQETRVTERAILAGLERLVFSLCAPARSC